MTHLLIYARLRNFDFYVLEEGIEKVEFWRLGWAICNSATGYTEHQTCTQKALIISREVIDVPFRVIHPTQIRDPNGGQQPRKSFGFQNLFIF